MKKTLFCILAAWLTMSTLPVQAASEGGFPYESFSADLRNQESLQRGARLFMNYCSGCHSLEFQRYNRTFRDLGIIPEVGVENLIFTGAKDVDQIHRAMQAQDGGKWFGTIPPDLSLTARAKGDEYIYNYLRAFYVDDSRPLGFNNAVFPGASMPNPLWTLQGLQQPVYESHEHCETSNGEEACTTTETLVGFEMIESGTASPERYKQTVADITNFLTYVSDPSVLIRMRMGHWVLIFIALMTILFYFLKKEYWRDVH